MEQNSTATPAAGLFDGADWFDPIEARLRARMRGFIEMMLEEELTAALGRGRYRRGGAAAGGYRHGVRHRQLLGSFGPLEITMPRGRLQNSDGGTTEWRSAALPRYARTTRQAEALIAATDADPAVRGIARAGLRGRLRRGAALCPGLAAPPSSAGRRSHATAPFPSPAARTAPAVSAAKPQRPAQSARSSCAIGTAGTW